MEYKKTRNTQENAEQQNAPEDELHIGITKSRIKMDEGVPEIDPIHHPPDHAGENNKIEEDQKTVPQKFPSLEIDNKDKTPHG